MRWLNAMFAVVVSFLAMAGFVSAQTTTGTITGRVIDAQKLSVPGATITVAGPMLQGLQTAVSSENGDYIVPLLPPGSYKVTFE